MKALAIIAKGVEVEHHPCKNSQGIVRYARRIPQQAQPHDQSSSDSKTTRFLQGR